MSSINADSIKDLWENVGVDAGKKKYKYNSPFDADRAISDAAKITVEADKRANDSKTQIKNHTLAIGKNVAKTAAESNAKLSNSPAAKKAAASTTAAANKFSDKLSSASKKHEDRVSTASKDLSRDLYSGYSKSNNYANPPVSPLGNAEAKKAWDDAAAAANRYPNTTQKKTTPGGIAPSTPPRINDAWKQPSTGKKYSNESENELKKLTGTSTRAPFTPTRPAGISSTWQEAGDASSRKYDLNNPFGSPESKKSTATPISPMKTQSPIGSNDWKSTWQEAGDASKRKYNYDLPNANSDFSTNTKASASKFSGTVNDSSSTALDDVDAAFDEFDSDIDAAFNDAASDDLSVSDRKELQGSHGKMKSELEKAREASKDAGKQIYKKNGIDGKNFTDKVNGLMDSFIDDVVPALTGQMKAELEQVMEFTKGRKKEVATVKKLVTLLKDSTDYAVAKLADSMAKNVDNEVTQAALSRATKEVSDIVAKLVEEIPDKVKSKNYAEDVLFSKFSAMTQKLFMSDNVASNVEGLVRESAKELGKEVDGLADEIDSMGEEFNSFVDDFVDVAETMSAPKTGEELQRVLPGINSLIGDAKDKVSALQSRILRGGDFSSFRIEDIASTMEELKSIIPSNGMEFAFSNNAMNMVGRMSSAISSAEDIESWKSRLQEYPQQIMSELKPGDIFNKNFSHIMSSLTSMESSVSNMLVKSTADLQRGAPAILSGLNNISGSAMAVSSMIQSLGNMQITDQLSDIENAAVQRMNSFVDGIKDFSLPMAELKQMEYGVKALAKTAERYAMGTLKQAVAPILNTVKSTFNSALDTVKSSLNTFKNLLNTFDPPATADIQAFMSSVGNIAPAARDALLQGKINDFKKTLESPEFLTKAGNAISSLNTFAEKNRANLTVEDKNMLNIISSYLSGEHKRAMMSMWISNVSTLRSAAVKSLDAFVTTFISPIEILVQTLEKKYPG